MVQRKLFAISLLAFVALGLTGCDVAVFHTKGPIAEQQRDLIVIATMLMLIVVVPVLVLTVVFAIKYRANGNAKYTPDWEHSTVLEVIWWSIPIAIILVLSVLTWKSSHDLDPYKPLEDTAKPITIEVMALDWKWLFIYPEQNIASVNWMQFPVGIPVNLKISAQAPMNSLWIPRLAGQVYAMEGMQTKLHLKADEVGSFEGLSSNFSGRGFNGMKFIARATSQQDFDAWVDSVRKAGDSLTTQVYQQLALPSENNPVSVYSWVQPNIFMDVMMSFMGPQCQHNAAVPHLKDTSEAHGAMDEHEHCQMRMADSAIPEFQPADSAANSDMGTQEDGHHHEHHH